MLMYIPRQIQYLFVSDTSSQLCIEVKRPSITKLSPLKISQQIVLF